MKLPVSPEMIEQTIAADPWLLYWAAGVKDGTLGSLSWDQWWSMTIINRNILTRFATMFPDCEIPTSDQIEAVLLRMIERSIDC